MKGLDTKGTILNAALQLARLEGLETLSIGRLAKDVGLSKSGLFAHFKSKQTLQIKVIDRGVQEILERVILPALKRPRGEPRLRALFDNWLEWAASPDNGGCVFLGAAVEYDDKPGTVREHLVETQRQWTHTLTRAVRIAQQEGHLSSDMDPAQFAFRLYSVMMGYHLYHRLLADKTAEDQARSAFESLLQNSR